ncbi:MAG: tRNA (uridine(34)/cytosine(34)/5-carboxymethylaminomethyluridine(34)-2'-O)-methyltransferase TrmL [Gammaproteobacteria bacterium]|nr:tRNA (uridine(34)/cytosine(34)/5-carboxymethylaminomethyluridine(34)-2'-O)-methyltransferase TrmL [Gammaproteobacteria bacterium]
MFHIVLYEPEIPPNTGNIIRLCANTGCRLHLIEPLGFELDDVKLKRAGLDYHEYAPLRTYPSWEAFLQQMAPVRLFALSTHGKTHFYQHAYRRGDTFLFGPETRGLPKALREALPVDQVVRIPLQPENRSLNLSNAAAIVVYEAWRQQGFAGAVK